nr:hypothetical protein [Planctomycetota bacterium]
MSTQFRYLAKDPSGKTVTGTMSAGSEGQVAQELRKKNLTPVSIQTGGKSASKEDRKTRVWEKAKP